MYSTILVAAALQHWERYSTHALAAREVAAVLARGASTRLHVLSAYEYENVNLQGLTSEMAIRHRDDLLRRTDDLMGRKIDEYVAPLIADGLEVTKILRVGNARDTIVQVATEIKADLLIIGTHSKRGLFDIALGGTAQQISKQASCPVVLVSPKV
jgi:nucleotide-binding universal stress UspA family protein